jgi:hypothetical protein
MDVVHIDIGQAGLLMLMSSATPAANSARTRLRHPWLSRRPSGLSHPAGASFKLDGEEAGPGTLLTEHVIGIEQHTAIERETTAADASG